MIATVPRRMALLEAPRTATKILEGPAALGSFKYVMIWHERMQTDAAHTAVNGKRKPVRLVSAVESRKTAVQPLSLLLVRNP
jgi:hypothetical protein